MDTIAVTSSSKQEEATSMTEQPLTLDEFYQIIDGDLEAVRSRLLKDSRISKFVHMYAQDSSVTAFHESLLIKDLPEAFRAVHTIKGTARDLGFTPLFQAAATLSDFLRESTLAQLPADYDYFIINSDGTITYLDKSFAQEVDKLDQADAAIKQAINRLPLS